MIAKRKNSGVTVVELLIVVGIIALLVGLLLPAISMVKQVARETKQKAQFAVIELGLVTYKNDFGDYPPSDWTPQPFSGNYCGAQKLAEALLGLDLLGFHPQSEYTANGLNSAMVNVYASGTDQRRGPYVDRDSANVFRLDSLYGATLGSVGMADAAAAGPTHVLCDSFSRSDRKVPLPGGSIVAVGAPVLYYKANPSGNTITERYNIDDGDLIIALEETVMRRSHPLGSHQAPARHPCNNDPSVFCTNRRDHFYGIFDPRLQTPQAHIGLIQDPKVTARAWPYRPDSFILISAGADGLYGTPDDIKNFGN